MEKAGSSEKCQNVVTLMFTTENIKSQGSGVYKILFG
jgi:hypothetical protein